MNSLEKYAADRRKRQRWLVSIFAVIGIASFGGTALFGIIAMFRAGLQQPASAPVTAAQSARDQLKADKANYELVLQREPNNRNALEGLVQVQLQLQDLPGAKATLEKLIKLDPKNPEYKLVLDEVKQRLEK
ncbi:MAG: tetratricopeptide repeat protein [Cyanobacteria bacterium]|nr:tetratricopeptide repeat protein [Cyanobacteriota bacterium]MDW8199656.1 tetratricopeptide repeat protein [Cyanobacteriota bacterium SKYGB_h_bin112]